MNWFPMLTGSMPVERFSAPCLAPGALAPAHQGQSAERHPAEVPGTAEEPRSSELRAEELRSINGEASLVSQSYEANI